MTLQIFTPDAERMHDPTDHPQFNESMYFNFVDGEAGFATLIRMGNRVNEGHAEVTVLLYMPDGRAAIHFDRAPITDNSAFDSGGLRFDIIEPLKRMRVTYSGDAHVLRRGSDLEDPKRAFTESPVERLDLQLDYENTIPVYGLGSEDGAAGGIAGLEDSIATGHYQGPCRIAGAVQLGDDESTISGFGFRDHSWGPRIWQGPRYWRWISGLVDADSGFVGWVSKLGERRVPDRGMVLDGGEFSPVTNIDITSTYGDHPPHYPETMTLTLHTDRGDFDVSGSVLSFVPLRNRREGQIARLAELVCRYDFGGKTAYGISEYHDLMADGVPAGMSEV